MVRADSLMNHLYINHDLRRGKMQTQHDVSIYIKHYLHPPTLAAGECGGRLEVAFTGERGNNACFC